MPGMDQLVPENDQPQIRRRIFQYPVRDRFDVVVTLLGYSSLDHGWNFPDLTALFWRLYVNRHPGAAIRCGQQWLSLEPGVLYLIPAWLPFSSRSSGSIGHAFIHCEVRGLPGPAVRSCFTAPVALPEARHQSAELAAIGASLAAGAAPGPDTVLRARAVADAALALALLRLEPAHRALLAPDWHRGPLAGVLSFLHADPTAPASNRDLARIAGCTPDHLVRRFRSELGQTPARYVLELRLAAAAQALVHDDATIDEVAETHGFANRHSFSRAFARYLGCGPAAWRRRQR